MWIELRENDFYRLEHICNVWKSSSGQWLCRTRNSEDLRIEITEATAKLLLINAFRLKQEAL